MDSKATNYNDSPEQLLDVFKQAALSVTKLYKSSVSAETRAKADGYQDCLDDLVALLDRDGLNEQPVSRLRKWIAERREGREATPQSGAESEDENDKPQPTSHSESANNNTQEPQVTQPASEPNIESTNMVEDRPRSPEIMVPTRDDFTFQSEHQYPNIELLDLSDSRSHNVRNHQTPRNGRSRTNKSGIRTPAHLGRGAGTKRRMDFEDFFGGCFNGKDPFGGGGKRSRHS